MRFTQLFAVTVPTLVVAGGAATLHAPIPADTLEAFIKNLNEPEALDAFRAVLNGEIPPSPSLAAREANLEAELAERRECCEYGICCNIETCKEDGSSCLQMCFGYQSPWQQLGCIAGK
ncbi:uncharacterized protein NFIA_055130 [Aspergillus fischeri NRRL 181]|uniref:Uncharacterized protein n=1 Tax=Neosartorya fischeri (strain ATCC 1020 / DSM 3700 / CBS 544.65 / FGSC A1164 / JCM 1740 / NRRL 181 / WB 181) TaxID=331117 RepID=A1DMZ3_NEOFI|nr:uncharacterized protein NFIA_055130 [Aspergillus fischeri NRRL 181]EAW16164.1 hypothetical protein NFIA_055130 [Aspergillus fischeri NRRL 181]